MNKHTATTADGHVFTRNSKGRVYTHCVLQVVHLCDDRKFCEEMVQSGRKVSA